MLSIEKATQGFAIPAAQLSPELRAAVERADLWTFAQRLEAVREYLNNLRVPYATGRVELKVRRSDCYGGARGPASVQPARAALSRIDGDIRP